MKGVQMNTPDKPLLGLVLISPLEKYDTIQILQPSLATLFQSLILPLREPPL